jgi:hypothetical protein
MANYTEYIGYTASLILLASFLMKRIAYLRILNSIGCSFFIAYGVMLPSPPVIVTNAAIICINIYYLTKKQTVD